MICDTALFESNFPGPNADERAAAFFPMPLAMEKNALCPETNQLYVESSHVSDLFCANHAPNWELPLLYAMLGMYRL